MRPSLSTVAVPVLALVWAGPAAAQTCGNFVREAGEQCDDGNTRNLDGCDASCRFEQTHRMTALKLRQTADGACTAGAFGSAFHPLALAQVQAAIDNTVASGGTSVLLHFRGLDDLAGLSDPALQLGLLSATPLTPGSTGYNGTSDLDWWYAADPGMTDGQHLPVSELAASITSGTLTAGPGHATIKLPLTFEPTSVAFSSLVVTLPVGSSSLPTSSAGGFGPGHEPYEHLDPALPSFATGGVANTNWATFCGDISAASLAAAPAPPALLPGGGAACDQGYSVVNTLLDILVGGCHAFGVNAIAPTQPDRGDPSAPDAGAGPPYTLAANGQHVVDTCRDAGNNLVPLNACLADAAYSSHWKFTSDRVIAGDDRLLADGFESGDTAAWSAAATDGGDLTVTPAAALNGTSQGLQGVVDDTSSLFVRDDGPEDENHYRARFWLDPSAFDPGEASGAFRTRVFIGFEDNPTRRVFAVVLKRQGGQYSIRGRARRDDDSQADTAFYPIPAGPNEIFVEWIRSSGAGDGLFRLHIEDGTMGGSGETLTGLANARSSIDSVRLGALSVKAGASGTLFWDEFLSRRRGNTN
jgi:cysteine-rich repeat protein